MTKFFNWIRTAIKTFSKNLNNIKVRGLLENNYVINPHWDWADIPPAVSDDRYLYLQASLFCEESWHFKWWCIAFEASKICLEDGIIWICKPKVFKVHSRCRCNFTNIKIARLVKNAKWEIVPNMCSHWLFLISRCVKIKIWFKLLLLFLSYKKWRNI